jgi:hypothetical protein
VPAEPSLVSINGRQLLLQRRNSDSSLALAVPYVIKGVNWSPASTDTNTSSNDPNNVTVRRVEFGKWYQNDIPLLKAMNVNTVRLIMDPGLPDDPNITVPGLTILDEFYRNGIMVIMTVDNSNNSVDRIPAAVDQYKNHPAILMWSLGSEWNVNQFFNKAQFPTVDSAAIAIESAAQLVKLHDTGHPVVSSYGSIFNKPNDIETYVNVTCPTIDVWSFNEYRGPGFSRFFDQWRFISGKPMFLGEFGIDAYNSTRQQEDQATHALWGGQLWEEIARNLSADDSSLVALGGTIFEFNDEWWKATPYYQQDPTPAQNWFPPFPDGLANEDWWGIVTIQRTPRQLYGALTTRFAPGYHPPTSTKNVAYRAESKYPNLALFWENGALMYQGEGASNDGGRGFNIAAIDPSTGRLRDPIQRFDTYATRDTGADMLAMIAYLDGVPNGTILLISAGDELGLNLFPPNDCTFLNHDFVSTALQRLQALGSNQIQNYCYRDQWAMIAIKGQGMVSESLSHDNDASTAMTMLAPALLADFNLIGNSLNVAINVPLVFGNQDAPVAGVTSNIESVWKWNAALARWSFYSPQLTASGSASYAASHHFEELAVVNPGEGFWMKAINPITLPAQTGSNFTWNAVNFPNLNSGYNLIATADSVTPSQFNIDVSQTPPSPGAVPTSNFVSLWMWDALASKWYFYSPLPEASGGLPAVKAYADSHNYLHFQDYNKTLGIGTGFWVNKP